MRRAIFKLAASLAAIALLCVAYGLFIEPKRLVVTHVSAGQVTEMGKRAVRIVHISDIHIGGMHVDLIRLEGIIKTANEQRPDIIILTGDYVSGHEPRGRRSAAFNNEITQGLAMLGDLSAPEGVYAVFGNHDNWYDGAIVREGLEGAGITALNNEKSMLENGMCIVGLADHDTDTEDASSFDGCENAVTIAAMHSPDSFTFMPRGVALALAGHTHGGQVNIPLIGRRVTSTKLGRPYAYGLTDWRGTPAYISAGIGTSILPVRFRSPPEIAVITLYY